MCASRSALSCLLSIQRESCVTVANAMSSSRAGREASAALLRTNRSPRPIGEIPAIIGSQRVAGATVDSRASFRGPTRRSYTDASVRRQVAAAIVLSSSRSGNCTSFSASANVVTDTSGPNAGPAPNAVGAPGGSVDRFCACARNEAAAASAPNELKVRNSRRDLDIALPDLSIESDVRRGQGSRHRRP